jgi:hypothetical protein
VLGHVSACCRTDLTTTSSESPRDQHDDFGGGRRGRVPDYCHSARRSAIVPGLSGRNIWKTTVNVFIRRIGATDDGDGYCKCEHMEMEEKNSVPTTVKIRANCAQDNEITLQIFSRKIPTSLIIKIYININTTTPNRIYTG